MSGPAKAGDLLRVLVSNPWVKKNLKDRFISDDPLVRTLSLATLVNTFGNGLLSATTAIYFTRFVDVSENAMYWYFVVIAWLPPAARTGCLRVRPAPRAGRSTAA